MNVIRDFPFRIPCRRQEKEEEERVGAWLEPGLEKGD